MPVTYFSGRDAFINILPHGLFELKCENGSWDIKDREKIRIRKN